MLTNEEEKKLHMAYESDFSENKEALMSSKEFSDLKKYLLLKGFNLESCLVASMVESQFETLFVTIVTRECIVFSIIWDFSKNDLLDAVTIENVTDSTEYYELWPQIHLAVSYQNMTRYANAEGETHSTVVEMLAPHLLKKG
jgi:hypothetical protein